MLTIGINYSQMHDSSACIVRDGELLFAVAEERLSRVKHDAHFPQLAILACLHHAGAKVDDLDEICFGWQRPGSMLRHDIRSYLFGLWPISYLSVLNSTRHFLSMWHQQSGAKVFARLFGSPAARIRFVDHHLAHAISAYSYSGFEDAAVVVIDGRGAWEATSIWYGHSGRIDEILTIPFPNSLGLFYASFTEYLGFQSNSDEWKVMGLAPYGRPGVDLTSFISSNHEPYSVNSRLLANGAGKASEIEGKLGPARIPETEIRERDKDVAYAVQEACEIAMMSIVRMAVEKTGCRNVCLAGGVALNSKANGKILASGVVDRFFVQPAASDDGAAIGAALAPYMDQGGRLPIRAMRHVYLGPSFDDDAILRALGTYKIQHRQIGDVSQTVADLLASGRIVGWFQGRMEFGPRALGSRSILADARDPEMNAKVNNAVKFREWWRPFAPSMKKEIASQYLESATDSPFMVLAAAVRPEKRNVIPAVTHIDGSARPHTVEREVNPLYWDVIDKFGQQTGVPVILNTSFNLRGEPIVHSPTDAIRTFFSSGMDALVLGSFLLEK